MKDSKTLKRLAENTTRHRKRHEVRKSLEKYKGVEGVDYIECKICKKRSLYVDVRHLKTRHNITKEEYTKRFPDACLVSKKKKQAQSRPNNKGNTGKKFSEEHREKMSLARTNGISWTERGLKSFKEYRAKVRYLSNQNFIKHYWKINPENLKRGNEFHLDHIFPVREGFRLGINPKEISKPSNLQILSAYDNFIKAANYAT